MLHFKSTLSTMASYSFNNAHIGRYTGCTNDPFRHEWVHNKLEELKNSRVDLNLLDVGAGPSIYRKKVEDLGIKYFSTDFNNYQPSSGEIGQQSHDWNYGNHDFVCDILDIPEDQKFNIIICTEVLEHVPDPIAAFEKICKLLKDDGELLITVPLHSLIHQAPYYFASGLSPYWFLNVSKLHGINVISLDIYGNYKDFLAQEISRSIEHSLLGRYRVFRKFNRFISDKIAFLLCLNLSEEVQLSAGFGTLFHASK